MNITQKQCATCPWKKDAVPEEEIEGYSEELHKKLKEPTIAESGDLSKIGAPFHVMACHKSKTGRDTPCIGWVSHQLGPGNNIRLRLFARNGRFNNIETVGPQHDTFEDTLPKKGSPPTTPKQLRSAIKSSKIPSSKAKHTQR